MEKNNTRRQVLSGVSTSGLLFGLTGAVGPASAASSEVDPETDSLEKTAIEVAIDDTRSEAVFTSLTRSDGIQLYYADGVKSVTDKPRNVEKITDADLGVRSPSWIGTNRFEFSMDGKTYATDITHGAKRSNGRGAVRGQTNVGVSFDHTIISEKPRQMSNSRLSNEVTAQGTKHVVCKDFPKIGGWCFRVHVNDGPKPVPRCDNHNTAGSFLHHHLAIWPKSNANGGFNLWAGSDNDCYYVGEEHYTGKCVPFCDDSGTDGLPSLSALVDGFKEVIKLAAAAAGVTLGALAVKALAYYLGSSTLAPPSGAPAI